MCDSSKIQADLSRRESEGASRLTETMMRPTGALPFHVWLTWLTIARIQLNSDGLFPEVIHDSRSIEGCPLIAGHHC